MKWIDEVRGTDSIREVARRSGLNQATLNRQINLDMLTFDAIRDIARAYSRSLLADLVRTGFLAPSDVSEDGIESALHAATDEQLVLEVARRLDVSDFGTIYDKPISRAVADATITQIRPDVPGQEEHRSLAASDAPDWQDIQEKENE